MSSAPAGPNHTHGTLVEVDGVGPDGTGVLLLGRSGIGKSESAVELVVRGHRLVADDVVQIDPGPDGEPIGQSPDLIRHYVQLRGIGIVHVPSLFGPDAVTDRRRVDLVIRLLDWGAGEIERTGLEEHTFSVQGIDLPCVELPVAPGRNVATLVVVAARNFRLRREGKSAAGSLDDRVSRSLRDALNPEGGR